MHSPLDAKIGTAGAAEDIAGADGESLAALQAAFAHALLDREAAVPSAVFAATPAHRSRRFGVYRNNVFASLVATMRARFPVIERLVGEEFFASTARQYIAAVPPRSPLLLEYGEAFADFLAAFEPVAALPYLADVARLEWLRARAYHAADASVLDAAGLAAVAPERLPMAVLGLHPSVGLLSSRYPIVSIWETNTHDAEVRPIGSDLDGQDAFVVRRGLEVIVVRLGPGGYGFIAALASGRSLADAANAGGAASDCFSLPHAIAALLQAEAVSTLWIDDPRTT